MRDELSVHRCASILDHLEGVMGAEIEGDFPVAKVSWPEFYITGTEILANISRVIQFDAQFSIAEFAYNHEHWIAYGQTMAEKLLPLADSFPEYTNDGSGLVATHWLNVQHAKKATRTALEGKH